MDFHSRRDFLRQTAVASGALTLGQGLAATAAAEEKPPDMAIARYKDGEGGPVDANEIIDKRAETMTGKVIDALGGMKRFVNEGDTVWIKPNIAWDRKPEQAANTNPAVVAALVRLCIDAGAGKVKVGDNTCNPAKKSYIRSGIAPAAEKAGAEIVYLDENRFKEYEINGKRLRSWPAIYPEIVESDLVINVPIVKHHSIAKMTLCMKNYMGVVDGKRALWHQELAECLCDITNFMKPRLCVVDATRILTKHGPTGGSLADVKRMDTVAAGIDVLALDAFGAKLMGHKPDDIETVKLGHELGMGEIDYRKLNLCEIDLT